MFPLFVDWVFIKRMYQNNPILDMLHMLDDLGADYQAGDSRCIIHYMQWFHFHRMDSVINELCDDREESEFSNR